MRALATLGGDALGVITRPDPEPGPHDAVVAVARAGICGSDLHMLAAGYLPHGTVMGHEVAGTVVAVGAEVTGLTVGQRVAVMPATQCGACAGCAQERSVFLCEQMFQRWIGLGLNDGGFAEYVRTPASTCFALPEDLTWETGALIEPFAVALHGVRRSRAAHDPDLAVGVLGGGAVGVMTVAALLAAGVRRVALAEPSPDRARVAESLGVSAVSAAAELGELTQGPPTIVFDCTGAAGAPAEAIAAVAPGGQVVLVGVVDPGVSLVLPGSLWCVKEVDVLTSMAYTHEEFGVAVAAAGRGELHAPSVVAPAASLEDGPAVFATLRTASAPVKVQLSPAGA